MSRSLVTRVAGASALVASRCRHAIGSRPRVVYVGAAGSDNVGDRTMFEAVQRLVPSVRWIPADAALWERRLWTAGLSGARYFSLAVLGGGTMMNAYAEAVVETLLESGVPFVAFGTGAGSGGWDLPPGYDLQHWITLLDQFEWVTVRGPRTREALEAAGFPEAVTIGDLALACTKTDPPRTADRPRRLFINLIEQGAREVWNPNVLEAVARALSSRGKSGWDIVPFAMHPSDRAACEAFALRYGLTVSRVYEPRSGWELVDAFETASLVISMRLHGAVFATAAGAPVVSIGYREKCHDFMESVGAGRALLPVAVSGEIDPIVEQLEEGISWAIEHRPRIHERALACAHEIRRRAACICTLAARRS